MDYLRPKGVGMANTKKINFTPYGIAGVVLVLLLLLLYPKFAKNNGVMTSPTSTTSKVTVDNEFSNPATDNTMVADTAGKVFFLTVTAPQANSTVSSSAISVSGKTVPNAEIFVNEIDTKADAGGNFTVPYVLEEGENYIVVGANDDSGNYHEQEIMVTFES